VRPSLLLFVVVLLWGCATRVDQVFAAPGRLLIGSSGAQPGYAIKLVTAKQAPAEVVGGDGSLCRLTPERFAKVGVGDWLACEWTIAPDTTAAIARVNVSADG
jgi:hypothetical protein